MCQPCELGLHSQAHSGSSGPGRNAEHAESQSTAEGSLLESIDDSLDSVDEPGNLVPFHPLPFSAVLRASAASAFHFSPPFGEAALKLNEAT